MRKRLSEPFLADNEKCAATPLAVSCAANPVKLDRFRFETILKAEAVRNWAARLEVPAPKIVSDYLHFRSGQILSSRLDKITPMPKETQPIYISRISHLLLLLV